MPDLEFRVMNAEPLRYAAEPHLILKIRIINATPEEAIRNVTLRCQIRIEPTRRQYSAKEKGLLRDLFGEPERWNETVRSMLWTHCQVVSPPFSERIDLDMHVPCSFDFNVTATKYFVALEDGLVPLNLLFSGTVFYHGAAGTLQVSQIPWEKETATHLPVQAWRDMMDHYYPNTGWLCLRRDVFDRLYQYKVEKGILSWELLLSQLLDQAAGNS